MIFYFSVGISKNYIYVWYMFKYYLLFIIVIIILIFISCCLSKKRSKKKKQHYEIDYTPLIIPKKRNKYQTYLKYIDKIDDNDVYLTWRYQGMDLISNHTYGLVLLPYQNKQNEFILHMNNEKYLKQFYQKYNLYMTDDKLNNITFLTSEYNPNKDNYIELESIEQNIYIVKASLWWHKKPFYYLHINEKNKLYFETGINDNIAKFLLN